MKAFTREDLDARLKPHAKCERPGCDCDGVVLATTCQVCGTHLMRVFYADGVVRVVCSECHDAVSSFQVACVPIPDGC